MDTNSDLLESQQAVDRFAGDEHFCGSLLSYRREGNCVYVRYEHGFGRVQPFENGCLRVTYSLDGEPAENVPASLAVVGQFTETPPSVEETETHLVIRFVESRLQLRWDDGAMSLFDARGRCVCSDHGAGFRWNKRNIGLRRKLSEQASVYGLGEKTGTLDKRGRTYWMWNTDEPQHYPTRDPLYQSVPFLVTAESAAAEPDAAGRSSESAGTEHGGVAEAGEVLATFVDNLAQSWFDIGESREDSYAITVNDRLLDSYLLPADSVAEATKRYGELTGRMPMPPLWALGYHQSRYSYYPESTVRELADSFREREIPCDAIHLDIHHMDGCRVFTWDDRRFPDPASLLEDLAHEGFRTVLILDPGVKVDADYHVFRGGMRGDHFLRYSTGELYVGRVWPGEAVFPDFTRGDTRRWWADLHQPLLEQGVAGIWNDMNEPADFTGDPNHRPDFTVPSSVEADGDGHPRGMDYYHNAYGLLMCQSTYEGLRRFRPAERPFVLTRSGFAGIQRYAAVWIGDNHSWWEHLAMSIPMFLNMGISGMPFVGGDVGGFQLNADGELYARWVQLGAFTPFFRGHTALDTKGHEPWAMGERVEEISRFYIGLRYRLLPYIYTQFRIAEQSGLPVFRPLLFTDPADRKLRNVGDAFTLGSDLLVAPVVQPGKEARSVYLPSGLWYDFWTGASLSGPGEHLAHAPLDTVPIYVRAGSVIPMQPVRQHTESALWEELTLYVFPPQAGAEHTPERILYEDDGSSLSYREGSYAETRIRLETERRRDRSGGAAELALTLEPTVRGVSPSRREVALCIYGVSEPAAAFVQEEGGERETEGVFHPNTGSLTVRIPEPKHTVQLRITGVLSHSGDW